MFFIDVDGYISVLFRDLSLFFVRRWEWHWIVCSTISESWFSVPCSSLVVVVLF